jgi:hypothetical protein
LEVKFEDAVTLFEQKKYDRAIEAFSALLLSDYKKEARIKIDEAVQEFATAMRRQAATIFVEAQKSRDPEIKRRLFLESRSILQQLLAKYPNVDIADKITKNLEALEAQISQFAPDRSEYEKNKENTCQERHN